MKSERDRWVDSDWSPPGSREQNMVVTAANG